MREWRYILFEHGPTKDSVMERIVKFLNDNQLMFSDVILVPVAVREVEGDGPGLMGLCDIGLLYNTKNPLNNPHN